MGIDLPRSKLGYASIAVMAVFLVECAGGSKRTLPTLAKPTPPVASSAGGPPQAAEDKATGTNREPSAVQRATTTQTSVAPLTAHDPFLFRSDLFAVWAFADYLVYAVGESGSIVQWNGHVWTPQYSGTVRHLRGIWGADPKHIWAVGDSGTVLFFDGSSWSQQRTGTTHSLSGVHGHDAKCVWAVGDQGTVLRWNGSTWLAEKVADNASRYSLTYSLSAVWTSRSGEAWSVSSSNTVLKRRDGIWEPTPIECPDDHLIGMVGFEDGGIKAVGSHNAITEKTGSSWSHRGCDSDYEECERHSGIWGTDANDVCDIDSVPQIRYLETGRDMKTQPAPKSLFGIHGFRKNSIWAVGADATILQFDGTDWFRTDPERPQVKE